MERTIGTDVDVADADLIDTEVEVQTGDTEVEVQTGGIDVDVEPQPEDTGDAAP